MAEQSHPLTAEHLIKINNAIRAINETGEFIKKCKNCGLEVEQEEMKNAQQLNVAENLKRQFFPQAK